MRALTVWLALLLAGTALADLSYPGFTEPVEDKTYSATVAGRVEQVKIPEGGPVKAGGILIELDSRMEQLEATRRKIVLDDKSKLDSARSKQASKQATLEVARRKLIWESTDELEAARKRLATLQTGLEGTRALFKTTQSVSKDELAVKELEVNIAEAEVAQLESQEKREKLDYEMALDNDTLTNALNAAQVQALEMEEKREATEHEAAVEQLERRVVKSSINGVVRKVFVQSGENCTAGQPLVHVVDPTRVRFIANIDANVAEKLAPGTPVVLAFNVAGGQVTRPGTITFLSPVVDAASGLREVKAEFTNEDLTVTPGLAGEIRIGAGK